MCERVSAQVAFAVVEGHPHCLSSNWHSSSVVKGPPCSLYWPDCMEEVTKSYKFALAEG